MRQRMMSTLKHRFGWLLVVVLQLTLRAVGQALPAAAGPGSYVAVGESISAFQADYGQRTIGGVTAFAYIHPTWRYGVEAEVRTMRLHTSEGVNETDYLVGPRLCLKPWPLRPYVKFLVGAGDIRLPFGYAHGSFFTYTPGAGVEYLYSDRIAWRVLDFEYQDAPQFPFGPLRPYGLSAGVSLRLNSVTRIPKRASW